MRSGTPGTFFAGLASTAAFWIGLVLLAFAPVIRGGNRHMALVLLEWLGLLLLLVLMVRPGDPSRDPGASPATPVPAPFAPAAGVLVLALAPLWTGLLQLLPLPIQLWTELPGRDLYVQVLAAVQAPAAAFRPLSLTPDATWISVLAGIPLTAVFLWAHSCTDRQLAVMARVLVVLALVQAVWGLLQVGSVTSLYFGAQFAGGAIGSFANANHFASYIAMTLPLAVLLLRQAAQPAHRSRGQRQSMPMGIVWSAALFVLLAAVLTSGSRTGVATSLFILVLTVSLLHLGGLDRSTRRWGLAGVAALLIMVGAAVGLEALVSRFASRQIGVDAGLRWQLFTSTWEAALAFWPAGSGLGSFAGVYPRFQPAGVVGYAEHAHSDYVQWLMECGLLFVILAALAAGMVIRQGARMVRRARSSGLDAATLLQASCGLGLLAVFLHSWVDFNLRIPANALSAAFLLGVFLRPLVLNVPRRHRDAPARGAT